jgi:hypothetical protein
MYGPSIARKIASFLFGGRHSIELMTAMLVEKEIINGSHAGGSRLRFGGPSVIDGLGPWSSQVLLASFNVATNSFISSSDDTP